jgi:hypothetical protein
MFQINALSINFGRSMKGKAALAFGLAGSVAVLALIAVVYHGENDKASAHMCLSCFEYWMTYIVYFGSIFPRRHLGLCSVMEQTMEELVAKLRRYHLQFERRFPSRSR